MPLNFETAPEQTAAPHPLGWRLDPKNIDATGHWTHVTRGGSVHALQISNMFPNGGVALGRAAAGWGGYGADGLADPFNPGPHLFIGLNGEFAVSVKAHEAPAQVHHDPLSEWAGGAEVFAPRWETNLPYVDNDSPCPGVEKAHAVYVYSSAWEPNPAPGEGWAMITWHEVFNADSGCDPDAVASYQVIITQLPEVTASGRHRVRVEYRYIDCPVGDAEEGPRAGLVFDSQARPDGDAVRAVEFLGAREQQFEVELAVGAIRPEYATGASGDASLADRYCLGSNLGNAPEHTGRFVIELGDGGRPDQSDLDRDGVPDDVDNCPPTPDQSVEQAAVWANPYQSDQNNDGDGDACDTDVDGDEVFNNTDLCVFAPDMLNTDLDADGVGDACDPDLDGDGFENESDNCPSTPSPNQADLDNNGKGFPCDFDEQIRASNTWLKIMKGILGWGGWAPSDFTPLAIDVIQSLPTTMSASQTYWPVDVWADAAGVTPEEVLTVVDLWSKLILTESERAEFDAVADQVMPYLSPEEQSYLKLYRHWAKTKKALGSYIQQYGGWYSPGTTW